MREFKALLQQEFVKRTAKNSRYSLRAFAESLGINHATLSGFMSGKRTLTKDAVRKLAQALQMGPEEIGRHTQPQASQSYFTIQQDAFNAISEWYFDAILELTKIPKFKMEPSIIAMALGISDLQAKIALETLERLELIVCGANGHFFPAHDSSTNILDPDFTSAAHRKYQVGVLQKSIDAVEAVDRSERDHTSNTMAIQKSDLPKAKKIIQKFRRDLDKFLQRDGIEADEIYQLQVSFFPLTQKNKFSNGSRK